MFCDEQVCDIEEENDSFLGFYNHAYSSSLDQKYSHDQNITMIFKTIYCTLCYHATVNTNVAYWAEKYSHPEILAEYDTGFYSKKMGTSPPVIAVSGLG